MKCLAQVSSVVEPDVSKKWMLRTCRSMSVVAENRSHRRARPLRSTKRIERRFGRGIVARSSARGAATHRDNIDYVATPCHHCFSAGIGVDDPI